jgi:flagellar basal-body rod protein FlgF
MVCFCKTPDEETAETMILEMTRPVQGGLRQERKLEAVSNNLANVDTTGFKKDFISFDRQFKAQLNQDFSQGDIVTTGNPFDVALGSDGFFKVDTARGLHYTRTGNFSLNNEGILVDMNGNPVMGQGGAILIDLAEAGTETITINEIGEIFVNDDLVDVLDVVDFEDKGKMEQQGANLYAYTGDPRDEIPVEGVKIAHRALEKSNVQAVYEMVKMIDYHRMFETFSKSMLTFDEVDGLAINNVGKLT